MVASSHEHTVAAVPHDVGEGADEALRQAGAAEQVATQQDLRLAEGGKLAARKPEQRFEARPVVEPRVGHTPDLPAARRSVTRLVGSMTAGLRQQDRGRTGKEDRRGPAAEHVTGGSVQRTQSRSDGHGGRPRSQASATAASSVAHTASTVHSPAGRTSRRTGTRWATLEAHEKVSALQSGASTPRR